jgi:hypothetical protein
MYRECRSSNALRSPRCGKTPAVVLVEHMIWREAGSSVGFPLRNTLSLLASLCYNGATGAVQFRMLAEKEG